jgi:uncharacterized protein (TIGR00266 family)
MPDQIVDYKIFGDDMQFVELELDPEETAVAEAGAMMYMESGIQMSTHLSDGSKKNSGVLGAMIGLGKRALTGENLFMTFFTNKGQGKLHVSFSAPYPGKIVPINLAQIGGSVLCQKGAFLAAAKGVSINIGLTKRISSGFFGGEGFILQKLEGTGNAFIHAGGTVVEKTLSAGQTLYVDTGSLVALQPTVDFDIQMVTGVKSMFFGGEGYFLSKLTGPGKIWGQSMPFPRLMGLIYSNIEPAPKKK